MKKDLTEIIFILDRSGSMIRLESDTIRGYNAFLESQREEDGEALVTTVLFDDKYEIIHNGVNIKNVQPITYREYYARGGTALLDAVGKTIIDVEQRLCSTPDEEKASKVIFVIITDGQENSSKAFSYCEISDMVTYQQQENNWEFIFFGANMDAVREAENLGIRADWASTYRADPYGTEKMYCSLASNITDFRNTGRLNENWNKDINNDTDNRR